MLTAFDKNLKKKNNNIQKCIGFHTFRIRTRIIVRKPSFGCHVRISRLARMCGVKFTIYS